MPGIIMACQPKSSDPQYAIVESVEKLSPSIADHTTLVNTDTLKYCLANSVIGAGGYDLVNYHSKNTAELGAQKIQHSYDGVIYYFTTEENKTRFQNDPEKYLPAYGGWCSMTLAMGRATKPTYDNFKIIDGRLHLFERTISINGQQLWIRDPQSNAELASKNYSDFIDDGKISSN